MVLGIEIFVGRIFVFATAGGTIADVLDSHESVHAMTVFFVASICKITFFLFAEISEPNF